MAATIRTEGLTRAFGDHLALDGLTLEVGAGEVLALLGPNGAGKTTTVRLLNGVLRPDRGGSRVLGLDPVADGVALRRRTAVLTEAAGLDDRLTARENVSTLARIRGLAGPALDRRVDELLERLGVADRADVRLAGASTGQRKRVALACALVHDPELLFLDEPTSGLDPAASRDVVELIAALASERGRTVVLCTHLLPEASRLAGRVAVLRRGRLAAFGTEAELAAALGRDLRLDLELGPGDRDERRLADALAGRAGVRSVTVTPTGARLALEGRAAVPGVVEALVTSGIPVHAVVPRPPTLEDVYFAVQDHDADVGAGASSAATP